jgi:hypothetical protein
LNASSFLEEHLSEINEATLSAISSDDLVFLFVQAFARDSYADGKVFETTLRMRSLSEDDDVTTFHHLRNDEFLPGTPNEIIANEVRSIWQPGSYVIAQWEVTYCLWRDHRDWYLENRSFIRTVWPNSPKYLNTVQVKEISKAIMAQIIAELKLHGEQLRRIKVVEVANIEMIARAVMILWKLNIRPLPYAVKAGLDPTSKQRWTRSEQLWFTWEVIICRPLHLLLRWVTLFPPKSTE